MFSLEGVKLSKLAELNREISLCRDCELAKTRTSVVPGEGAEDAEIMFIGEAPGFYEDQQGRPFVGSAGKFLDELLRSIGLDRNKVYICNIIKCRPPQNRDPLPNEVESCRKWLDRQIELISPKALVTLGRHSLARFFPGSSIGKVHGTAHKMDGRLCFAMYHPAAALHQQSLRRTIEADILKLPEIMARHQEESVEEEAPAETQPEQLSLF
ncbi:MAG: uracil-DNA glycosylase [Dehalococcoidia bacterium]